MADNNPSLAQQITKPAGNGPAANPIQKPKQTKKAAAIAHDQRQSVQNHLLFSEIRDGIVIMRDGSLRTVIITTALNFDLKSPQEQEAIEYAFQGFLNGLHYPVQIVVKSRRLDLSDYLEKLDRLQAEQDNPLLADLMEDYVFNIRGLLEEVNIMDKEFYIVIPLYAQALSKENIFSKLTKLFKPNQEVTQTSAQFEQHKRDLIDRTNSVAGSLAQMGLKVSVLRTQEIIELFYNSYNLDQSASQGLISAGDLETPLVDGAEITAPTVQAEAIKPPEPDDMFSAAAKKQAASLEAPQVPLAQQPTMPAAVQSATPTSAIQVSPGASAQVNSPNQGASV